MIELMNKIALRLLFFICISNFLKLNSVPDYNKDQILKSICFFYTITHYQLKDGKPPNIKEQVNEKNIQIEKLKKERTFFIVIIFVALVGLMLIIFSLFSRQTIKQKLLVELEEKARLEAKQKFLLMQQEHLRRKALAASLHLDHKNTFINEITEIIKGRKDLDFQKILKEEHIVDKDFSMIQSIIQEVHPNFFKRLHEVSKSKLSNQDLRYAAYIYLNMTNYQMASLFKVAPDTIRKTKYRLKQKIGLGKDQDLQVFIQNLEINDPT
ncbi:hypothetical protein BAS10_12340 [Elizabethkingia meningoseptica]|uniref:helix-turn-helix transcriptional regulator n=1 Tax=Elizabethkingia meningoseptica TaxID=238 RepID=UPI0009995C40|nr:hypothetical protein [Elizabethkingia meningoseptica]OPB95150.1 hypothetical protein BAS10_12340 [Elizabethkingia meningoseptica]